MASVLTHMEKKRNEKKEQRHERTIVGYQFSRDGNLKNKIAEGDLIKWHYKITNPHPSYLIMLGIGKYKILEDLEAE